MFYPLTHDYERDVTTGIEDFNKRLRRPLGLKAVVSASWELLGSWGSSNETLKAEIVITPKTPVRAGYDFDQFDELVDRGRLAARDRIEAVVELVDNMLHV